MHYADFQPFSGHNGDYSTYQKSAVEISQSFRQGIFSINDITLKYPDLYTAHYYPVIIGSLYALTMPEEIIGLLFNVWLVALAVIFAYLIILELGGTSKNAFIVGLIISLYPSYIFNTGLLLKDAIEICFTILGLLFLIKTIKKLTWLNFLVLYSAILCVTHFRFYIGYALIISFLISWFLISKISFKKRIIWGIIFVVLFGFIPEVAYNQGYYGINSVKTYLNKKTITFYRHTAYNPVANIPTIVNPVLNSTVSNEKKPISVVGLDSSFVVEHGPIGYVKSFLYTVFGPLPWQIKNLRQLFALFETLPWYILLLFIFDGIVISYKKKIKEVAVLLIFSFIVLIVVAIFDNNYGLILRIRIPAFISLLCIGSFGFNNQNILYNYLEKIYEKIFSNRRSRIYRFKHS